MISLARAILLESMPGVEHELPRAGAPLENPFVYDAVARDLKVMAQGGELRILDEVASLVNGEALIERLRFVRLR